MISFAVLGKNEYALNAPRTSEVLEIRGAYFC